LQAIDRDDLELVVASLRSAGDIAREGYASSPKSWEKSKGNPVTETDIAVDLHLKTLLCGTRADYGWLSEESVDNLERLGKSRVFVVDPIDGTLAFIKRKPEFTVCIAVVEDGKPVVAGVYNPLTEEMFTACIGEGAFLNGRRLSVTHRNELPGCRMLVARVEGWKRSGDLDPDVAPADAAEALQSLILGYIVQTTITRDVSAEAHARALCAMISGADRAGEP